MAERGEMSEVTKNDHQTFSIKKMRKGHFLFLQTPAVETLLAPCDGFIVGLQLRLVVELWTVSVVQTLSVPC